MQKSKVLQLMVVVKKTTCLSVTQTHKSVTISGGGIIYHPLTVTEIQDMCRTWELVSCVRMYLEDVRQLTVMLRRCTNNLNQYAKRANETGSIYAADIENLQNRLDEIWELSRQSLARLAAIR